MPAAAGVTVTITRGLDSVELTAWVSDSERINNRYGETPAHVIESEREFVFAVADLGTLALPARADLITDSASNKWRVLNDVPFEYVDSERTLVRVFTKRVPS